MSESIVKLLETFGAAGVGFLMLVENVFPPIPSEIVMPWAGYAASQGKVSFLAIVVAGSIGSFAGAALWYWLAVRIGQDRLMKWAERHGRWLTISPSDIENTSEWFARWGGTAVLVCRMIPGIRTLISVPAGFAGMPFGKFSAYTAIGTVLWTTLLAGIGYWLGDNYGNLSSILNWVSTLVVGGMFLWWLWRILTRRPMVDRRGTS